ncbi:SphA family protein [Massilia niastensis]|uniref:SphA family protein n=1 Tax=Massilia niastensis TaxID=544911 RepID=UPI0003A09C87|nr:transporter [Massilia niastensis]
MQRTTMIAPALMLACGAACATEGAGLGVYPDGLENFMSGALPPPGLYGIAYGGHLRYDSVRDGEGKRVDVPNFGVRVGVVAPRLVWVTGRTLLGGQLAFHAVAPLLDVDVRAGAGRWKSSGLGDMTFGAALGYHASPSLHYLVSLDVVAPTGRYARDDPASLGKNVWTVQPVLALSYVKARGWNLDLKAMVDFNRSNRDTGTRSGRALHADYALGWGFGNGWVAGLGGHGYRQFGDDTGPGAAGRARAFAVGPVLKYDSGKGWFLTAKLQREFGVRNRPRGEQFHVKAVLPL